MRVKRDINIKIEITNKAKKRKKEKREDHIREASARIIVAAEAEVKIQRNSKDRLENLVHKVTA